MVEEKLPKIGLKHFLLVLIATICVLSFISGFNFIAIGGGFLATLILLGFINYLLWPVDEKRIVILAPIAQIIVFVSVIIILLSGFTAFVFLPLYVPKLVLSGIIILFFGFLFSILMYDFIGSVSKFFIPVGVVMMILGLFITLIPFAQQLFL